MKYRLALDLGAKSIGWCILNLDDDGRPIGLRDIGVRVFPDGREVKTDASLAAMRRLARQMRRRRDRYIQRRQALLNALVRHGLMPTDAAACETMARRDPYALRAAALERRLDPHELGRALFHLNQRRGFRSNRKTDRGNEEEKGKIKTAADALSNELRRGGHVTLGSWLAERHGKQEDVRARLQGAGAKAAYPFYPTREMVMAEFDTIWTAQAGWNPGLTDNARAELRRIIFFQRDLRKPVVGKCWLEPAEDRAPRARPSTQAFRIAQDLAHLAIRRMGQPDEKLTEIQRETLYGVLVDGRDMSFGRLRTVLGLTRNETFNIEFGAREGLKGSETAARLAGLGTGKATGSSKAKGTDKPLAALWPRLTLDQRDAAADALLDAESDEAAIASLVALEIPTAAAEAVAGTTLPDGHASLSTKAMRAILPHLLAGLEYSAAVQAAGYRHHSDDRDGEIHPALPYYGEVLGERLGTGTANPADRNNPERFFGKAANPTVHVALNQLRHVVNPLLARHGHPHEVIVEVLRDVGQSAKGRAEVAKEQAANARRRAEWVKCLAELNQRPTGRNLAFMRLWHEQAADPKDRVCPYTGTRIGIEMLFSGAVEEDHILPFSVTLDDSFNNRVLALREANRRKTAQTPFQAFGASPQWPEILGRAASLPPGKAWRFAPDALERWQGEHKDFLARHLTDSAYLTRLTRLYLRAICDPDKVWGVPGRLTALLRDKLALNSASVLGKGGARKERTDHRHHAIDALTVGLIDRSLLQRVTNAAKRADETGRRLLDDLGEPWPGFAAEAAAKIGAVVVSHKLDAAPSGALHNDTAYGRLANAAPGEPNVAHRVPIGSFAGWSAGDVERAVPDEALRARIGEALKAAGKPAQAAALSRIEHSPNRPVRRVKLHERLDGTVAIHDRRSGRPYKLLKLDANHRIEFWRLPPKGGRPGEIVKQVISLFEAAADAEAKRLGRPVAERKPHPAARRLMSLQKNDIVALGNGAARRLLRVVKFSEGQLALSPPNESGNLKARDADRGDPFKYLYGSIKRFKEENARKIHVDPTGKIFDPGPLAW